MFSRMSMNGASQVIKILDKYLKTYKVKLGLLIHDMDIQEYILNI